MSKNKIDGIEMPFDKAGGTECTVTGILDEEGCLRYLAETDQDTDHFGSMDSEEQVKVLAWIRLNCMLGNHTCGCSSYGMKHILEHRTGIYMTNNQFKEAMMLLGFYPEEVNERNWSFYLSGNSPVLKTQKDGRRGLPLPTGGKVRIPNFYDWMLAKYSGKDNQSGNLAYAMRCEMDSWPEENTREANLKYLERRHSSPGIIRAFNACWRRYEAYCRQLMAGL